MSSTEAAFSANMRLAIAGHDVQVTVRGTDGPDFDHNWAHLAENMGQFLESVQMTVAAANAAPLTQQPVGTPPPAPAAVVSDGGWGQPAPTPQAAPPQAFSAAVAPVCAHGPRNPVSKVGAKGPWKAWMCNAPQGGAKCDPQWVQKNSPEWNSFPG